MNDVSIHPTALVESDAVGPGTRVWAFAHILEGAVVGAGCNVGDHAFIEGGAVVGDRVTVKNNVLIWYGVRIDDDVFVGPNVVFTNDLKPRVRHKTGPEDWVSTHVKAGASIGANSTIVCGNLIGASAMVGAGSVVTRDVPDHALVFGNPARQRGWVCECGAQLADDLGCRECGLTYRHTEHGLIEVPV